MDVKLTAFKMYNSKGVGCFAIIMFPILMVMYLVDIIKGMRGDFREGYRDPAPKVKTKKKYHAGETVKLK